MHSRWQVNLPHEFGEILVREVVHIPRDAMSEIHRESRRQFGFVPRLTRVILRSPDIVVLAEIFEQPLQIRLRTHVQGNMMVKIDQQTAVHRAVMRAMSQRHNVVSCRTGYVFKAPPELLAM